MSVKLGRNIESLTAQRNLATESARLEQIFQRLSSGQRINRSSDDAAGLAISESLRANARVFGQGMRNLNDSISLVSVGSSALDALKAITTRKLELATQVANGVFSSTQRSAMDLEAQRLTDEYNRIVATTSFNGRTILATPWEELRTQAGYGASGSISFSLASEISTAVEPGSYLLADGVSSNYYLWFSVDGVGTDPAVANRQGIQVALSSAVQSGESGLSAASIAAAVKTALDGTGVFTTVQNGASLTVTNNATGRGGVTDGNSGIVSVNGTGGGGMVTTTTGSEPTGVATADFDGDGRLDIVTADTNANRVSVLLNPGNGQFSTRTSYAAAGGPISVTTGDFNNDGRMDFVTANFNNNTASIFLNNGDGTFANPVTYSTGVVPRGITAADFDGDGWTDFATADFTTGQITVRRNNQNGTFSSTTYATSGGVNSIVAGDVTGDGVADLLVTESGGSVGVFLNNGTGTFASRVGYSVGSGPNSIALGDFDGDGDRDVVITESGTSRARILTNSGTGTFTAGASYSTSASPYAVTVADLNGDGRLDFATADGGSNAVSLFINNGSGTFATGVTYAMSGQTFSIASGDFDGDGAVDIAAPGRSNASLAVRFGTGSGTLESSAAAVTTLVFNDGRGSVSVTNVNLLSSGGAQEAISTLNERLLDLNAQQGIFGAVQARLEAAFRSLDAKRINTLAADSRLRDLDVASETSALVRSRILQSIGTAVLAQANQSPRIALRLLTG